LGCSCSSFGWESLKLGNGSSEDKEKDDEGNEDRWERGDFDFSLRVDLSSLDGGRSLFPFSSVKYVKTLLSKIPIEAKPTKLPLSSSTGIT
jgi:hypothetical protein